MRRQEAPFAKRAWLDRQVGIEDEPEETLLDVCVGDGCRYEKPDLPDFSEIVEVLYRLYDMLRFLTWGIVVLDVILLLVGLVIGLKL